MRLKRILFCGASLTGKRFLLECIAVHKKVELKRLPEKWSLAEPDTTVHCTIQEDGYTFEIAAPTQSILYFERRISPLLANTDVVVWVTSCVTEHRLRNKEAFLDYARLAKKLGKNWEEIPWLLVANLIDRGNPAAALKEVCFRFSDPVCTNATTGEGVVELWQRLSYRCIVDTRALGDTVAALKSP